MRSDRARLRTQPTSDDVALLLSIFDRAYDRQSWHGTNLRGSIRGLSPTRAAWRPSPGRHNIWELVVHAAYWKYAVWRRLTHASRGSFPLKGSDWFRRPESPTDDAWRDDVRLLQRMHSQLREVVAGLGAAGVSQGRRRGTDETNARGGVTVFELVAGVAAHDLYHAGQIQLLKKLQQRR
jgi:hypothetical protein